MVLIHMRKILKNIPIIKAIRTTGLNRQRGVGICFLLPSLLGICWFVLFPFADVVRRSFLSATGTHLTGLENYKVVLSNEAFRLAAGNTARFFLVCVPLLLVFSLGLAAMLHHIPRHTGVFKTLFLIPMAVPVASIVLLWRTLFNDQGLINGWIVGLGGSGISFMGSSTAFSVLVGSYIWKNLGYDVILWLAGLVGIPESQYDAAKVDGAGAIRIFWHITLPNLFPSLYTILVLSLINAFKVFREAYLVAGNYPHESIYLLQHLFNNWFRELSMDKLYAAAVMVALAVLVLILILRRIFDNEG